jgi:multidrug resistance efflux pump
LPGLWFKCARLVALLPLLLPAAEPKRVVRVTGSIQAVHAFTLQTPMLEGVTTQLTLTRLVPNGATVHTNDIVAEFDSTDQLRQEREAQAKFDDLSHQVDQKRAEQSNNVEKRNSDLIQAQADLKKAEIEIRKGPIVSEIDQQKSAVTFESAKLHVASLQRSSHFHELAEAAELRILELQRDRQKIAVDRQRSNAQKLSLHTPIPGMASLENTWRNNSLGHAQEGDQLWPGSSLLRVFDPSAMVVEVSVGEPDGAVLVPGATAVVHLDAFPQLTFGAHFDSASPIATSALGSPVKTFSARFVLDQSDPHLLPDLSVAVDIQEPSQVTR